MMDFYRYEDKAFEDGPMIFLIKLAMLKETQCGFWIQRTADYPFEKSKKRWVSKTSRKRYAYPTKEEALKGYIARKRHQVAIYRNKLDHAETCLQIAGDELMGINPATVDSFSFLPKERIIEIG
jgi:hypothetical protein